MDEQQVQASRRANDESATQKRASILGFRYLDTREIENTLPLIDGVLTTKEMHLNKIIPLMRGSDTQPYRFGVTSTAPQSVVRKMREQYSLAARNVEFFLISIEGYKAFMNRYDPPREVIYDDIQVAKEGDSDTIKSVSETLNSVGTDAVFDYLVDQADKLGASDIHIENQRKHIRVRMRIDGALHPVATLEKDRYRVLMAALATRANISTASTAPQSGHMNKDIDHGDGNPHLLNLRVEAVPTMYGQDVVMRLFNFNTEELNLDLLGMGQKEREQIDEVISHPRGMVLMVGPTGSGKSTTLYSMLNALNNSSRKLITLEDPIENSIPGITQIPIDTTSGQRFADGLRSVLRQDPDVVMIGEIRDEETARTAIQASITGHLVLSSFHANSTSAAFSRMIDMIGQNPIFSSAIRLLIAQRLVRRLVADTKEEFRPDTATTKWVKHALKDLPEGVERPDLDNFKLWRPVASDEHPFGYKGRLPIMEQMIVNEEIQAFIRGDIHQVNTEAIEKVAVGHGMITLHQAGVLAALSGDTTLEEINRVI